METMEKNNTIEKYFDRYFAGAELPPCDLSKAKREISARKRGRARKSIAAIASSVAVACIGIIIGLGLLAQSLFGSLFENMLPERPQSYLIADTTATAVSYFDARDKYDIMDRFTPFTFSENADAEYTLYSTADTDVLLRADLKYTDGFTSFRATVWCDLTEGKYSSKDFKEYRALIPAGENYGYSTEYINGEYVSRACLTRQKTEYVIDIMSPNQGALDMLVSIL